MMNGMIKQKEIIENLDYKIIECKNNLNALKENMRKQIEKENKIKVFSQINDNIKKSPTLKIEISNNKLVLSKNDSSYEIFKNFAISSLVNIIEGLSK